jgi:hypothetical protein
MLRDRRNVIAQVPENGELTAKVLAPRFAKLDDLGPVRETQPSLPRRIPSGDKESHLIKERRDGRHLEGKAPIGVPVAFG